MGHFYPRQQVLAPVGLVTEPNEYGQYPPGALKTARNTLLRLPGKLDQAPNVRDLVTLGDANATLHKLMPSDSGQVFAIVDDGTDTWTIYADGVAETMHGSASAAFSSTGRISWAQCNDRMIVNGKFGCLVRDPDPISTDWRPAGLPQAIVFGVVHVADAGWLDADQMVGYRVCLVRRYAQDYTLRSAPSPIVKFLNQVSAPGTKVSLQVRVSWPSGAGIEPDDVIELYRTDILNTNSESADPGSTFKLVQQYALTASDIASPPPAGLALTDTQATIEGTIRTPGRELYTNPGIEGENYANLRPPIAQCLASFKGFCFYGNTTERAQFKFAVPGGIGPTESKDLGIGVRQGAGVYDAGFSIVHSIPAADMVGVKIGQVWGYLPGSPFPPGTTVTAVGASFFEMSDSATISGNGWLLADVIEIAGVVCRFHSVDTLLDDLNSIMEVQINQAVGASSTTLKGLEFTLMWNLHPFDRPITVRATNGKNYSPPLPEFTAAAKAIEPIVRKNRLCWSKEQQPEHAPSVSETFVGFGEMYALNATRDALWIWCSDGLYRLSGNGGAQGLGAWQVDYSSATLLLCAPQASTVLDDRLYGYTNDGVVEVDSAGNKRNLSAGVIGNLLPGQRYAESPRVILERNETEGEVLATTGAGADGPHGQLYVYNVRARGWTELAQYTQGYVTALAMFRLPPGRRAHMLIGVRYSSFGGFVRYGSWDDPFNFLQGLAQYQPLYGDDPLELKRWMWADYLFDENTFGEITAIWNGISHGPIPIERFDVGTYARAGCPREVGLSHSLSPGFSWDVSSQQRRFEGISLAIKQRTNQSKKR